MLRLKKIEKHICPEWCRVNTHKDPNVFFEYNTSNSKKQLLIKNEIALIRLFFVKSLLFRPYIFQYIEIAENPILLQTFDSKTTCIISERTLIYKLWGIVIYKVLKS